MNKEKNCIETPAVIDLRKQPKEAYSGSKKLLDYESGEIVCLCVSGIGKPGGEAYADAIQALYSFVYTLKFTLKGSGLLDYKILPLECKWGDFDPATTSAEDWSWTLQIRVPPEVTEKQIDDTARII